MIGKEVLNYTITEFVGKGGMGSVYIGVNKYIKQKKVAIKVINADMVNSFTREKIKEEAEHLASLNHQNIVKFQNLHVDEDGTIYLILEYADGLSLDAYIATVSGLIVEDRICPIFEPILDGMAYAHKHKIVHKDIKPTNIIINSEGVPKILDFGIASIIKEGNEKENVIMGTPSYMSPEQVRGGHLDERSDIYSLGVLLHQLLTGHAPYDTTTMTEVQINKSVVEEPLPRMKSYYKYVSDKVQKVVDKATAKDPKDRFQSCAEFKTALHNAIYPPKVPTWAKCSIVVLILAVLFGGAWLWNYTRLQVAYYADYVEQWGVPVGIHELSHEMVNHRGQSYRFEMSKGKVRRVSLVNYVGKVVSHHDSEHMERPSDMYVYYGDNGQISYVKVLDANGRVVYIKNYNDKLNVVTFCYDDEYRTELYLAKDLTKIFSNPFDSNLDRGKISRHLLTYDENGFVTRIRYAGAMNKLYCDVNGIYGRAYQRDDKGRIIEEMYLGFNDSVKATKKGLAIRRHYFDENDLWTETHYFAADGVTGADENGTPRVLLDYDQYGNRIGEKCVDDDGNYVIRTDLNVCGAIYELDEHGLTTKHSYIGTDGEPCFCNNGYVSVINEYDANGFISTYTCYDDRDSVTMCTSGYAMVKMVNDDKGNALEMMFCDRNGHPIFRENCEFAGLQREYDSIGNTICEIYLDTVGKPYMTSEGTAGLLVEYNNYHKPVLYTYIDTARQPVNDVNGVGRVAFHYDVKGNETEWAQYDATGKKRVNSSLTGISYIQYTYNDNDDCIETAYYDAKGKLCNHYQEHKARIVRTFNDRGDVLTERYFNAKNKLTLVDGVAGYDKTYDDRGNLLASLPLGVNSKQSSTKLEARYTYDERDNELSCAYFDNDKPAENYQDIHREEHDYNLRNQVIETRYFNKKGQLSPISGDRYAIARYEYDSRGNVAATSFYDVHNKPVAMAEGYACHRSEYDPMGRIIHQLYFDENGKPTSDDVMIPEGFCGYDKWGNINYLAGGDGHGNIIVGRGNGFAIMRREYDIQGNLLWTAYYNEKDQPMNNKHLNYHKEVNKYDEFGNKLEMAFYDMNLKPALGPIKYHKLVQTFMENGSILSETYYGTNGKKININGYCSIKYFYNKEGINIRQTAYCANGKVYLSIIRKNAKSDWQIDSNYKAESSKPEPKKAEPKKSEPKQDTYDANNWQSVVKELQSSLPMDVIANELYLKSITNTSNTCTFVFYLTKSKYEVPESTLKEYKDALAGFFAQVKELFPSSVTLVAIFRDVKEREISRYTNK